ncbi:MULTISPECIES: efflux RND transporter periplasmic adaptor subunit [unclassified Acinetobacter]|uniref:efflux RND transporter periplasmic adaptor subunit n=1 Tax=unclassified Acinetobacter TaxID=196816 RepID=UPI002934649D|nr:MULTISPECIES: efflux RND transporter periplasmic adaptor subunit [unclassified Acinetobacter]WOE31050.1 efflux RND transporter periplasmic adaptor subunit [Acinetobacter sp. SAAs470]WOE39246.1 efflux RND transporter periplasmic adaptor subunit [Acinetobacter sp. SAAs474]
MKNIANQYGKVSQKVLILIVLIITALIALGLAFWKKTPAEATTDTQTAHDEEKEAEQTVSLTAQQVTEQGIQLHKAEVGPIEQIINYPARLVANTDQQAHVAPSFSGQVQSVNVALGDYVQKGQALAVLWVPDLVDQQAELKIAQTNLQLAQQDYQRERDLWAQGISAKQDYQRASNAYRQAQIQLQAAQTRLSAYGARADSNGRYILKAPISGVISQKDIVVGENVQLASSLFVIDQLDQLWLEFLVPNIDVAQIQPNQIIEFKSLQTGKKYQAQIVHLTAMADTQTGRLQVRAKVLDRADELRPNLMVNIELQQHKADQSLRVLKRAVQQIDGKDVVFVPHSKAKQIIFNPQPVTLGPSSVDGQWVEITKGLKAGQSYVGQGSFLLKSELEKGEASHAH